MLVVPDTRSSVGKLFLTAEKGYQLPKFRILAFRTFFASVSRRRITIDMRLFHSKGCKNQRTLSMADQSSVAVVDVGFVHALPCTLNAHVPSNK